MRDIRCLLPHLVPTEYVTSTYLAHIQVTGPVEPDAATAPNGAVIVVLERASSWIRPDQITPARVIILTVARSFTKTGSTLETVFLIMLPNTMRITGTLDLL